MQFMIRLIISAVVAYLLSQVLSGVHIKDLETAILFAFVLAIFNSLVKPVLVLFTLSLTIFTLGLFLLVVNAIVILMADYFVKGIQVEGFLSAIIFSVLLSFFSSLLQTIFVKERKNAEGR